MKTIVTAALLLQVVGAPGAGPKPAGPAPLAPSGKWTVDYRQDGCILQRDYGSGDGLVTVGFNPSPLGNGLEIVTVRPGSTSVTYRATKGRLILNPSGRTLASDIFVYNVKAQHRIITTLSADAEVAADLRGSTTVAIELSDKSRSEFLLPGIKAGFGALKTCQTDLLKTWGLDATEGDRIKIRPVGNPSTWITNDDYPTSALTANQEGTSVIVWTVGLDGKASQCRVVKSSGVKDLDTAACGAVMRRATYNPAIGMDDKPMIFHQMRRVVWRLPE